MPRLLVLIYGNAGCRHLVLSSDLPLQWDVWNPMSTANRPMTRTTAARDLLEHANKDGVGCRKVATERSLAAQPWSPQRRMTMLTNANTQ
eukprot:5329245-Alexandrium_andersonii.AAC.1